MLRGFPQWLARSTHFGAVFIAIAARAWVNIVCEGGLRACSASGEAPDGVRRREARANGDGSDVNRAIGAAA